MKKRILPLLFFALLMLTACGGAASGAAYQEISQEKAKEMMDTQEVLILDVREQDEYDGGHIPGAVLLPLGSISEESAARVIPEKDTTVLVYCRSGSRSKKAAKLWQSWATPASMSLGASAPGPMGSRADPQGPAPDKTGHGKSGAAGAPGLYCFQKEGAVHGLG